MGANKQGRAVTERRLRPATVARASGGLPDPLLRSGGSAAGARDAASEPGCLALLRAELVVLERHGASGSAETMRWCIDVVECYYRERGYETLTLEEAARESGYSYSACQQMVGSGVIPNAGEKNKPLIERRHLPRKPGFYPREGEGPGELAAQVLAGR